MKGVVPKDPAEIPHGKCKPGHGQDYRYASQQNQNDLRILPYMASAGVGKGAVLTAGLRLLSARIRLAALDRKSVV